MAKLEIRDLNHEVEIKENELAGIKGGVSPTPIPYPVLIQRTVVKRFSLIFLRKRYSFATPIEIP